MLFKSTLGYQKMISTIHLGDNHSKPLFLLQFKEDFIKHPRKFLDFLKINWELEFFKQFPHLPTAV